jgi:hypothetical protein
VVAFNNLLFPSIDNNARGKDAFMTMDVSDFPRVNWCKVVVDEIRHAAIMWWGEKKKSIPGCAPFLIVSLSSHLFPFMLHFYYYSMPILFFFLFSMQIFYLDNPESRSAIYQFITPRARFFSKSVMKRIIREDQRRDRDGSHVRESEVLDFFYSMF